MPIAIVYNGWQLANAKKYQTEQLKDLAIPFEGVQHPVGSVQAGKVQRISKTIIQVVSADYIAPLYGEQIINFYQNKLLPSGWRQIGLEELGKGRFKLKFCQGELDLVIETLETNHNS